jgi:hypothetical protein
MTINLNPGQGKIMRIIVPKKAMEKLLHEQKFFASCRDSLDKKGFFSAVKLPLNKQNEKLIDRFESIEEDELPLTLQYKKDKVLAKLIYYTKYVKISAWDKKEFYYSVVLYIE